MLYIKISYFITLYDKAQNNMISCELHLDTIRAKFIVNKKNTLMHNFYVLLALLCSSVFCLALRTLFICHD